MINRDDPGGMMRRPQGTAIWPYSATGTRRWDPFREMEEMHRRMDDLFSQAFGMSLPNITASGAMNAGSEDSEPDVDIYENDGEFVIHAFLPGVDQNDIEVRATQNSISLTAEIRSPFDQQGEGTQSDGNTPGTGQARDQQREGANQSGVSRTDQAVGDQSNQAPHTQHRQSRFSRYSRFQFSYMLPNEICPDEVRAQFRNGRLELHLPKLRKAQTNGAVRIPINGSSTGTEALSSGRASENSDRRLSASPQRSQARDQKGSSSGSAQTPENGDQSHRRGDEQADAMPVGQSRTGSSTRKGVAAAGNGGTK